MELYIVNTDRRIDAVSYLSSVKVNIGTLGLVRQRYLLYNIPYNHKHVQYRASETKELHLSRLMSATLR